MGRRQPACRPSPRIGGTAAPWALPGREAVDLAALSLRRAPRSSWAKRRGRGAELSRRRRRRQVLVEPGGLRARTSTLGDLDNAHDALAAGKADDQVIAGPNRSRGLDGLVVDIDLSAVAGPRRERPALEEAGGPEPLVDPHVRHGGLRYHTVLPARPRATPCRARIAERLIPRAIVRD